MKYKRNAQAVLDQLVETKNNAVICKVPCKIQVPVRFIDVGLGSIGIDTFIIGHYPIILETGEYAVSNINAMVEINPWKTIKVEINGIPYYEFHFQANQIVINTTELLKKDTLMYNIFDELIFKGKIPWYLEYEDIGKIFDTAKKHGNSNVGQNLEIIELIASLITRSKNDRSIPLRNVMTSYKDMDISKITYIALVSIFYSVNSVTNKLTGAYTTDGITSALTMKSDRVEKIEEILRT